MAWRFRTAHIGTAAALSLLAAVLACAPATPAPAPAPPPVSEPAGPPQYTLDPPLHRNPVTITWHAASRSFFVGTYNDGTIYRGRLEDPTARVFLEGRRGQAAHGVETDEQRLFVAGGMYGDIRVVDLKPVRSWAASTPVPAAGWSIWCGPRPVTCG